MRLLVALGVTAAVVVGVYFVVAGSSPSTPSVQVRSSDWVIGSPRAEGFQPVRFARAIARVGREEPGMMALLVARHGRLVLERYYHEATRSTGFDVYSITKTITSALVGIAIYQRRIPSVNASLARFFGNEVPRRARSITVRQMLTMTAGWPGDADPRNDVGDPANLVRALLRRPVVHRPGSTFAYDTPSSHLLSAVLGRATGVSEERYAEQHLFRPLDIELADYWPKDDQGTTYGGTGLTFVARDAAKLGQLYLRHGRWHGRQLVPRSWVDASTRPHVDLGPGRGYGYDWWTLRRRGLAAYVALGYGGQAVAVVPKLDLVVAVFTDTAADPVSVGRLIFDRIAPTAR